MLCLQPTTPTTSTGPWPLTVAGSYAAWMPRKSLQGCTCGVSRDGGRARAPQQSRRPDALQAIYQHYPTTPRPTELFNRGAVMDAVEDLGQKPG
ncbi:hypothetical protein XarCFBP6762_01035 [Xanthomonas arboricola]|nr:hypothetical protein XarCFBP6762_01035 [Xanthomonas arboricola]